MTSVVIPNKTQQKFLCHSERSGAEWRISFWFTSLFLTIVEILPSSEWHAQVEPISWFVIISGLSFWTQRSGVKNLFLVYKSFFDNSWDSSFVRMTSGVIPNKTEQKSHCHSERSEAEWRISLWLEILPSSEWHAPSFLTKPSKNSTVILNAAERSEESLFGLQVFFWQLLRFFLRQNDMRRHS